jgi:hypothetical protein
MARRERQRVRIAVGLDNLLCRPQAPAMLAFASTTTTTTGVPGGTEVAVVR